MENEIQDWCNYSDLPSPLAYKQNFMNDTLETFLEQFESAQTSMAKSEILDKLISTSLADDEVISELRNQVSDLIEIEQKERDLEISNDIESGKYQLYICKRSLYLVDMSLMKDSNYYVKIDDVASDYAQSGIFSENSELEDYFSKIKPIYYIVTDDGIGTLKKKNIFPQDIDFWEIFTKFE